MYTGGQCSFKVIREENISVLFVTHVAGHPVRIPEKDYINSSLSSDNMTS